MWNKTEVKGRWKQVKGAAKEKLGQVASAPELEATGRREQFEGKMQERFGVAKQTVGDAVTSAGQWIKH
jgi:uncharacterized protein YjbJ (UPF0337 family)